jgi:hypothetical protein
MIRPPALLVLACAMSVLPPVAVRSGPAHAQPWLQLAGDAGQPAGAPMPVTTDTVDYCTVLERKIASHPNRPAEVRQLAREGQQMCDHGSVISGLRSLRRALMLLKHKAPAVMARPQG